jgi:hypothetical protein
VNRAHTLCDLEKALFLALNSRYVVQQRERMEVVLYHVARSFSGQISKFFFDILHVLGGCIEIYSG